MKRTKHRELRDAAHVWACRHWHFQDAWDFGLVESDRQLANLASKVEQLYLSAARFELGVFEAEARAEGIIRLYDRALSKLPTAEREHAVSWIERTVPVFRRLRRGQLWSGQPS
jgi:hypothetical protein